MRIYTESEILEFVEDALLSQEQQICVGHIDIHENDVPIMIDTTEKVAAEIIRQLMKELNDSK
jgi:hypothetical protein